jgi:hypothetical protein
MKVAMNRKTLIIILIAGIVTLFSLAFAAASFFYFKSKTIAPVCPNDGLQAETDAALEALEECLSEASAPQAVAVATSSVDDSHWFDLCQNTFKDFASLQVGDCLADSAVDSVKNQSMAGLIIGEAVFAPRAEVMAHLQGVYTCYKEDDIDGYFAGKVCFVPDNDSYLPRLEGDSRHQVFCFSDKEKAEQVFCSSGDTGRATVWVKKYKYTYFEDSESLNEAVEWSGQTNKQLDGVKIGSKMSGMTVLGSLDQDSRKEIIFSGQARITGDYWYEDQGEYDGGWACFGNLDAASEAKMPKFPRDEKAKSGFCLPNSDLLQKELVSVATSGRATIDIDDFNLVYCECGAWSNATLIDVVSVKKK